MRKIEEIIEKIETQVSDEELSYEIVAVIRSLESLIEELKDDVEQMRESFEEYKIYGGCTDYGDY